MSTKLLMVLCAFAVLIPVSCGKQAQIALEDDLDKFSYALGYQVGQQLKNNNFKINMAPFEQAIQDILNDTEIRMTTGEMTIIMQNMSQKFAMERQGTENDEAQENSAKAKEFLEENALQEGVVSLPSGLQYKVLKEGTGAIPGANDRVKTNYRGTFVDGTEFDSSYKRGEPSEFNVTGVIRGWTEALQLMKEGSKWQLFVPPGLAYGAIRRGTIPPNALLIFEIELIEVIK